MRIYRSVMLCSFFSLLGCNEYVRLGKVGYVGIDPKGPIEAIERVETDETLETRDYRKTIEKCNKASLSEWVPLPPLISDMIKEASPRDGEVWLTSVRAFGSCVYLRGYWHE